MHTVCRPILYTVHTYIEIYMVLVRHPYRALCAIPLSGRKKRTYELTMLLIVEKGGLYFSVMLYAYTREYEVVPFLVYFLLSFSGSLLLYHSELRMWRAC